MGALTLPAKGDVDISGHRVGLGDEMQGTVTHEELAAQMQGQRWAGSVPCRGRRWAGGVGGGAGGEPDRGRGLGVGPGGPGTRAGVRSLEVGGGGGVELGAGVRWRAGLCGLGAEPVVEVWLARRCLQVAEGASGALRTQVPPRPQTSTAGPAAGCSSRRRRRGPRCTPRSAAGTPSPPASGSCCRCLGAEGSTWAQDTWKGRGKAAAPSRVWFPPARACSSWSPVMGCAGV